jgi:hypothetical protein
VSVDIDGGRHHALFAADNERRKRIRETMRYVMRNTWIERARTSPFGTLRLLEPIEEIAEP